MKELVKYILDKVSFAEKYAEICNSYKEYDNGMNFTKKQVESVLSSFNAGLVYASKDKSFYKDYVFGSYNARITMTYKYGFIECFYSLWNTENDDYVLGRFNSIASMQGEDFKSKVAHSFPVATSLEDIESILRSIVKLNSEFMEQFEKSVTN